MLKIFYPYEYVENVFSIDYKKLYDKGYRGIIFDIDNTLVHHGDDSTKEIDDLFQTIQNIGFKTLLLSNNSEKRIKRFIKNIDSLYIHDAKKPNVDNYLKAIEMMNIKKEESIFIGDQIFTDILGANKSQIANILVKYIRLENETKIGKRRHLENLILKFYKRNKSYTHRLGDIFQKEVD
ncbi:YqeG family HAD IIIA-type phosphatase [Intestinibacter sp.]|uniref:YqeG family HAD IIIA-type phosphatase n=1 Tax=Intestinibacter sp. TaxID=1965304 RepID=UPI002A75CE0A|nr:YqeG family HAD IIIA-type phosphatase [Intestinibacter sp.]MDY2735536.1 YqeG family HAD IIIA-type phosphatase [Intestinibacter sp.]MDY4573853.1 YqeG family HAD IIIA-type phosphatase [Intestinibacter sp.]